jgi:Ca2+-binding EF-hand superfamily protein
VKDIEKTWPVCEDASVSVTRERVNEIIKSLRHKLTLMSQGNIEEYTLRTAFRRFDTNKNGVLCLDELDGLLAHFGLRVKNDELCAVFKYLDANNNGCLEFEEFCQFIMEYAYTR